MAYSFSGFEDPTRSAAAAYGNPNANFQAQAGLGSPSAGQNQGSSGQRNSTGPQGSPGVKRAPSGAMSPQSADPYNINLASGSYDPNGRPMTPILVDSDNLDAPQEKLTQRQLLVREIVHTEHSYVRDLGKMVLLYLKPLRQKNILTEEESNTLFSNIEALYALNLKIANSLQAARRPNGGPVDTVADENIRVGDVFVSHIPSLSIYTDYCDNHDRAVELLSTLLKKNKAFADLEAELAESADCKGLYLKDFLIKPVQRICKYPLLFKNLAELTPENDSERPNVEQCCSLFEDIVMSINQAKDESMNASALAKYDEMIEGYPYKLASDSRRYIRDGTAMKAAAKKIDIQYLRKSDAAAITLLLFNDKLLLCTPKGKKLLFQKEVPLWTLVVIDTELTHPDHDRAFLVESAEASKKTWILWWENPSDKKTWFKLLRTHTGKAKLAHAKQEATADLYEVTAEVVEEKKLKRMSSSLRLMSTFKDKGDKDKDKKADSKKLVSKPSFVKGKDAASSPDKSSPLSKSTSVTPSSGFKSHAPPPRVPYASPSAPNLGDINPNAPTQSPSRSSSGPVQGTASPVSPRRANSMFMGQPSPVNLPPPVTATSQGSPGGRSFVPNSNLPPHLQTTGGSIRSQPPPPPKELRRQTGELSHLPPPPPMQATALAPQTAPSLHAQHNIFATDSGIAPRRFSAAPAPISNPQRDRPGGIIQPQALPPPPVIPTSSYPNPNLPPPVSNSGNDVARLQNDLAAALAERDQLRDEVALLRQELEAMQAALSEQPTRDELMYQLGAVQQDLQQALTENNNLKQQILKMQSFLNRPQQ